MKKPKKLAICCAVEWLIHRHRPYRRLLDHRVDSIQEGTVAEDGLKPEEASHIDRLQFITATEADHDNQD